MRIRRRLQKLLRRCRNLFRLRALSAAMPFDLQADTALRAPLHTFSSQVAAIPIRWVAGEPEVLLITTRGSGRWIVPKGWPMTDSLGAECAAREAFEEAGVVGEVERYSLGTFEYWKHSKRGRVFFEVTAYALHVKQTLPDWPERGSRRRAWFAPEVAARLTANDSLADLIRAAVKVEVAPQSRFWPASAF